MYLKCRGYVLISEHLNPHKNALDEVFTTLRYINLAIAVYYILEQIAKLWAYGIVYCQKIEFLYDGLVSAALITIQIIEQTFITSADNSADTGYIKNHFLRHNFQGLFQNGFGFYLE